MCAMTFSKSMFNVIIVAEISLEIIYLTISEITYNLLKPMKLQEAKK